MQDAVIHTARSKCVIPLTDAFERLNPFKNMRGLDCRDRLLTARPTDPLHATLHIVKTAERLL